MSAERKTTVVQAQVETPSLNNVNPLNSSDPLIQTVLKGEVPSNAIINDAIDRAKDNINASKQEVDLNTRGERLAKDATDILETAQKFINEKNKDDKIQEFLKHTQEASTAVSKETSRTSNTLSSMISNSLGLHFPTNEVKRDAEDAYGYARELFMFAASSKEFRSILLDLINFFQSSLNKATQKVNAISDSMKSDVNNQDANMNKTAATLKKVENETKDAAEHKLDEWNAQTKREYYQRFQTLLNRISSKPEYRRLLGYYWKWMDEMKIRANEWTETLKEKAVEVQDQVAKSSERIAKSSAFDKMWNDVKGIVDEFAGRGTFDSFYSQTWDLYYEILHDADANLYFDSLKRFVTDAVENPASLNTEEKIKEGEELLERGKRIINSERYSTKIDRFLQSGTDFINRITNDRLTNEFADKLKKFGADFALDSQGRPDLNVIQDSLVQIKNLVYPLVSKQLTALSIAKIAGTNDTYDWSVENLLISVPDLLPEYFELRTKNFLKVNLKELEAEKNNTKVVLEIKNIRPVFKNLKFWYKRKSFPRIEDFGTADVDLSKGNGARIKIIWKIKSKNNRPFAFSLIEVKCVIDSLEVTVKDAKHEILDRIATSVFAANIKQSVASGIVNNIVESIQPLNDHMNEWFATRPIGTLYDRANEQLHYAYESTNQMIKEQPIQKAIDYVKESASNAKEIVTEKASELKEFVDSKTEDLSKTVIETKDNLIEKATELKDSLVDKAQDAKVNLQTKVQETTKAADDWTHAWELKPQKKKHHKKFIAGPYDLTKDVTTIHSGTTVVTGTVLGGESVGLVPSK